MIHIVAYLLAAYLLVLLLITKVSRRIRVRRSWSNIIVGFLLILPLLPYVAVETQTLLWRESVMTATTEAMKKIGFESQIRTIKVLRAKPGWLRVYVVTPCLKPDPGFRASTIELRKNGKTWGFIEGTDNCIWSDSGSADGNVFPPYPSKGSYQ